MLGECSGKPITGCPSFGNGRQPSVTWSRSTVPSAGRNRAAFSRMRSPASLEWSVPGDPSKPAPTTTRPSTFCFMLGPGDRITLSINLDSGTVWASVPGASTRGTLKPAMAATLGVSTPQATTRTSASKSPQLALTPRKRPARMSKPVTSQG